MQITANNGLTVQKFLTFDILLTLILAIVDYCRLKAPHRVCHRPIVILNDRPIGAKV